MNIRKRGFTLIEILIVVAIIAILASVVLVGLGPTQQAGRDARRLSDLREVQNGLELFYQNCGYYPGGTGGAGNCANANIGGDWASLGTAINAVVPNVGSIPNDPSTNKSYGYWYITTGASGYAIGATLENANNSVLNSYANPFGVGAANQGNYTPVLGPGAPQDCNGVAGGPDTNYCIGL